MVSTYPSASEAGGVDGSGRRIDWKVGISVFEGRNAIKMLNWFKKKPQPPKNGPDYSEVDSLDKARALYQSGEFARIWLCPLEFGGQDSELNSLYVPRAASDLKDRFDALVSQLLDQGKVETYHVVPEYRGKSFVPSALLLEAKGEGGITERIEIW